MSEAKGLNKITQYAREVLNRFIAGINISEVKPLHGKKVRKPDFVTETASHSFNLKSRPSVNDSDTVINPGTVNYLEAARPDLKTVETEFRPDVSLSTVINETGIYLSCVPVEIGTGRVSRVESMKRPKSTMQLKDTGIKSVTVKDAYNRIQRSTPKRVRLADESYARHGLGYIASKPIELHPTSWAELDKRIIYICWQRLKDRAERKFGSEVLDDLEMIAIFTEVDLSIIEHSRFDPETRILHLKLYSGKSIRGKINSHKCAIIFGLVRGTGKVLQVVMPAGELAIT